MAFIYEFVNPEFVRDALSRLDVSLSSLRDAIRGADNRTLTDIYNIESSFSGKFPSAVALSDSLSNPTTTIVGSALLGFDGTNWRRVRVDSNGYLQTTISIPNIDVPLSTRASESTLQAVRDRLPSSLTASGNLRVAIVEDTVSLLKETTFTGRFPSAVALSDSLSNPTTTIVGSASLVWDGSNWRRLGGLSVDIIGTSRTSIGVVPAWLPSRQPYLIDNISVTTTEASTSISAPGAKVLIIKNKGDVDVQIGLNASVPATNPLVVRARTARVIVHSGVTAVYYKTASGSSTIEIAYFN